tara:strand:+ start:107 stop:484 length:378 start_codon:yes stop_codon:yes gene_type:complete
LALRKLTGKVQSVVMEMREAKFGLGDVVRHRLYPFRGVVVDVDAEFSNTEEWYQAIPAEVRPDRDQPFYHLLAENEDSYYGAYVSEQNLLPDAENGPISHPQIDEAFEAFDGTRYILRPLPQASN